jgi:methionyl aminopeptidase
MSILQDILQTLKLQAVEGATGLQLEESAVALLKLHKVESAFLNYSPGDNAPKEGFPNVLCVSINGEVIHGIPDSRKFEWGDVVKLDLGIKDSDGNYDDGAITIIVGGAGAGSSIARRLVKATEEALHMGMAAAIPGNTTHDIAKAIAAVAKREGFAIIQGYCGHGINKTLHAPPNVPNEPIGEPVQLEEGTRIAIEPMLSSNKPYTEVAKNKWTVKLKGGGITAHFEKTVTI